MRLPSGVLATGCRYVKRPGPQVTVCLPSGVSRDLNAPRPLAGLDGRNDHERLGVDNGDVVRRPIRGIEEFAIRADRDATRQIADFDAAGRLAGGGVNHGDGPAAAGCDVDASAIR